MKYKLSGLYLSNYIEEDVERKTVSSQFQVNVGVCSSVLIEVTNFNDVPSFNKNEWSKIDDYLRRFHILIVETLTISARISTRGIPLF